MRVIRQSHHWSMVKYRGADARPKIDLAKGKVQRHVIIGKKYCDFS
jgi:hypothetical protein